MADIDEIKGLVETGNKTIEAIRADQDALKSADAISQEKLAKMETSLADALSAKQDAELQLKSIQERMDDFETKMGRPGAGMETKAADEYKAAFFEFLRNPENHEAGQKAYELGRKATDVRTSTAASGGLVANSSDCACHYSWNAGLQRACQLERVWN